VKFERWTRSLGQGLALLAVGTGGALVAGGIGIPAGAIVGPLLASGFYRLAVGKSCSRFQAGAWRERYGRVGRLLLGTFIGAAFGPDVIAPLKAALLPMIVITAIIVGVGLGLGWALGHFTRLDATTAIISVVPGGLPAMVAMAEESEADATVVAAIHFSRLVTILVAVPALLPLLATTSTGTISEAGTAIAVAASASTPVIEPVGFWSTVATLAGGLIAGLLALHVGVPTGDMIGPLLAIGGANLLGAELGPLTEDLRQAAMLLIGTSVGAQMSRQSLQRLRQIALPAAVVIVMLIAVGLLLGWGLSRVTPLDLATALLSNIPGGASTMSAVAHDLGGDTRLVAALHLTRQLVVFTLVPSVFGYLLRGRHRGRPVSQKPASNR
jgi:membrane AbrB-like protein